MYLFSLAGEYRSLAVAIQAQLLRDTTPNDTLNLQRFHTTNSWGSAYSLKLRGPNNTQLTRVAWGQACETAVTSYNRVTGF